MAQSKESEFENYCRIGRLLTDIGATTAKKKLRSNFPNWNLQDILTNKRHAVYHLWNDKECCQCSNENLSGNRLILDDEQWNSIFTSHLPVCQANCSCNFEPFPSITIDSLDLTLTLRLLENIASLNANEISCLKDIDRTRCLVDTASSTWRLADTDFESHWSSLSESFIRLAGTCSPADQKDIEQQIENLESMENTFKSYEEAENFYRLNTLITEVGTSVLQDKLMDQFPNQTFEEILNNNIHDVYHLVQSGKCCSCASKVPGPYKKPMYSKQWELLYTKPKPDCSKGIKCCCCFSAKSCVKDEDKDVTLISCLLMNIANLNTSEKDLVKEIREAKNAVHSHVAEVRLSEADFKRKWDNVSQNIENLVKTFKTKLRSFPRYLDSTLRDIEKVKTKVLDISLFEQIRKFCKLFQPDPAMMEELKGVGENTAAILDVIQGNEANWRRNKVHLYGDPTIYHQSKRYQNLPFAGHLAIEQ